MHGAILAQVPHRDYATVAWSTLVVDQQLASVAIVGSASFQLYRVGAFMPQAATQCRFSSCCAVLC